MTRKRPAAPITSLKTFEAALWTAFEPHAIKLLDEERAWRKAERERDPEGRHPLPVKNRSVRWGDLLLRIFQAYREVTGSFDTLVNIPAYMKNVPPFLKRTPTAGTWRGLSSSRAAWVRYHVENYFHELYIFQNRVEIFLTLLRRSYREQDDSANLNQQCDRLEKALKGGLRNVITVRGQHVHKTRFDDASLRILESIEFVVRAQKMSVREYGQEFREARDEKLFWMRGNNSQIRKWLDEAAEALGKVLFMKDRTFRYPSPPSY